MERPSSRTRSPKRTSLPAITNGDNTLALRGETLSRMDVLEDRIYNQEKTTRSLIDRALRVKEDIVESLSIAQVNWQGEKRARALLQEHIRTITSVVKRLSREIEVLEDELRSKESKVAGNATAFKNLELHHVAGVTDLRGRVARCDHAIERMVSDLRAIAEALNELRQRQENSTKENNERFQGLQSSINDLVMKFEKYNTEQHTSIEKLKGQADDQVTRLDSKTKSAVEDVRANITSTRQWTESEYFKLTKEFQGRLERFEGVIINRQEKLEFKVDSYLSKIEKMISEEKDKYFNLWEVRLKETKSEQDHVLRDTCAGLRQEYRLGFNTVHESMTTLQKVLEAKLKLVEDDLKKSINNILRMVVLV